MVETGNISADEEQKLLSATGLLPPKVCIRLTRFTAKGRNLEKALEIFPSLAF